MGMGSGCCLPGSGWGGEEWGGGVAVVCCGVVGEVRNEEGEGEVAVVC